MGTYCVAKRAAKSKDQITDLWPALGRCLADKQYSEPLHHLVHPHIHKREGAVSTW